MKTMDKACLFEHWGYRRFMMKTAMEDMMNAVMLMNSFEETLELVVECMGRTAKGNTAMRDSCLLERTGKLTEGQLCSECQ